MMDFQQVILKLLINQHSICLVVAMFRSFINNSLSSPVTAIIISFFLSIAIIYNFIFLLVKLIY